jgi:hypothetical protein
MSKLKVAREKAEEVFANGDASQKKLLQDFWPDVFITEPYLRACKVLWITPRPALEDWSDLDLVASDAHYRLTICIRAKNMIEGKVWEPVYDGSENHYVPMFSKTAGSGLGFSRSYYVNWGQYSDVGSRLEYRTYDLMLEGVKEFDGYYQDFL